MQQVQRQKCQLVAKFGRFLDHCLTYRHESNRVCASDSVHDVDDDGGEVGSQSFSNDVARSRPKK
jgi:hypothetical protein